MILMNSCPKADYGETIFHVRTASYDREFNNESYKIITPI